MEQNPVVLITGSSRGIGRSLALEFGKNRFTVIVHFLREREKARSVAEEIEQSGGRARIAAADISDAAAVKALIDGIAQTEGRLDVLVNNAGITKPRTIMKMTDDEWEKVIATDLNGPFYALRECARFMAKSNGGGSIINISSDAGLTGNKNCAAYCAAKGGVSNLTRAMALDYARENIRVNAICPAVVDTPMNDAEICQSSDPKNYAKWEAEMHPVGRIGKPEEIAFVALMIASGESGFMIGSNVSIDGGLTA